MRCAEGRWIALVWVLATGAVWGCESAEPTVIGSAHVRLVVEPAPGARVVEVGELTLGDRVRRWMARYVSWWSVEERVLTLYGDGDLRVLRALSERGRSAEETVWLVCARGGRYWGFAGRLRRAPVRSEVTEWRWPRFVGVEGERLGTIPQVAVVAPKGRR